MEQAPELNFLSDIEERVNNAITPEMVLSHVYNNCVGNIKKSIDESPFFMDLRYYQLSNFKLLKQYRDLTDRYVSLKITRHHYVKRGSVYTDAGYYDPPDLYLNDIKRIKNQRSALIHSLKLT